MAEQQAGTAPRGIPTEVVEVKGKKRLFVAGKYLQAKKDVQSRIDALAGAIDERLPAYRDGLNAAELLQKARDRVDQRIDTLKAVKADLEAKLSLVDD